MNAGKGARNRHHEIRRFYPPLPPNPSASVAPPEAPVSMPEALVDHTPSVTQAQDPALTSARQSTNTDHLEQCMREALQARRDSPKKPQTSLLGSGSTFNSSTPQLVAPVSQAEPRREIQQMWVDIGHQQSLLRQSILKQVRAFRDTNHHSSDYCRRNTEGPCGTSTSTPA